MSAKRKVIHCGHMAEEAVSHFPFYICIAKECDGRPRCASCGSADLYDFVAPLVPDGAVACRKCGKVVWSAAV